MCIQERWLSPVRSLDRANLARPRQCELVRKKEYVVIYHFINNLYGFANRTSLETHVLHTSKQLLNCDTFSAKVIEFDAAHFLGAIRHRVGWPEHCICSPVGCSNAMLLL